MFLLLFFVLNFDYCLQRSHCKFDKCLIMMEFQVDISRF